MTKGGVSNLDPETRVVHDAIARQLVALRKELGMSQQALAEELGISFQQIQKYENGKNRIPAPRLYRMAVVMQIPVERFFPEMKIAKAANTI